MVIYMVLQFKTLVSWIGQTDQSTYHLLGLFKELDIIRKNSTGQHLALKYYLSQSMQPHMSV